MVVTLFFGFSSGRFSVEYCGDFYSEGFDTDLQSALIEADAVMGGFSLGLKRAEAYNLECSCV